MKTSNGNYAYIQVPLFMLRELFLDTHGTIDRILKYGLYRYSLKYECDIHYVLISLGIKDINVEGIENIFWEIKERIPENEPIIMMKVQNLLEFRDEKKTEFEKAQFAAFTAVKSILGKKRYYKTNKAHIICRMFGYSSIKSLPGELKPGIKELYEKYSTRYRFDKLLKTIEANWSIQTYSYHLRGLYIATSKMDGRELICLAECSKQKSRIARIKREKEEARKEVIASLRLNRKPTTVDRAKELAIHEPNAIKEYSSLNNISN